MRAFATVSLNVPFARSIVNEPGPGTPENVHVATLPSAETESFFTVCGELLYSIVPTGAVSVPPMPNVKLFPGLADTETFTSATFESETPVSDSVAVKRVALPRNVAGGAAVHVARRNRPWNEIESAGPDSA